MKRRKATQASLNANHPLLAKLMLKLVKRTAHGGMALCPAHDDHNPSLSVRFERKRLLLKCFAGCSHDAICAALGIKAQDLLLKNQRQLVATYDYHDANGNLLHQVLRYADKTFGQCQPDGKGGFIHNINGVRRGTPYHRPELNGHEEVHIAEGEKDVDQLRSRDLVATCNAGGAGKWTGDHTQHLVEAGVKRVIIFPDNDVPGQAHAKSVARSCKAAGLSVKIVALPDLPHKGDVSDWFDAGNTVEQLRALVERTPEWADARPPLDCNTPNLASLADAGWILVAAQQRHNPKLYVYGTVPVRVEHDEAGGIRLVPLTESRLRLELARLVTCTKTVREEEREIKTPLDLVRSMLSVPSSDMQLPLLRSIIQTPVVSPTGKLVLTSGYDVESRLFHQPYDLTADLSILAHPTTADLTRCRALIEEVFVDFPFVSAADRTHAVVLMLLPFVRPFIDGPTPLLLIEAPAPGSGKGLLATVALLAAAGAHVGSIPEVRDENELRKHITARFLEGHLVTLFDNVTHEVRSSVLSAALTSTWWEDRLLRKTETTRVPINTIWVMTGNNVVLHTDIARRTVRIRLDPKVERPWTREGFHHPNLLAWVKDKRAELIRAILTIVQAWLSAGQPASKVKPLGSFEAWSRVMGGLVTFAGYEEFLGNTLNVYEEADAEGEVWGAFTAEWWALCQDKPVSVKDLYLIADRIDNFDLGRPGNEKSQRTALGIHLRKKRDAIVGPYRIEMVGVSNNAAKWRLRLIDVTGAVTIQKGSKAQAAKSKAKY